MDNERKQSDVDFDKYLSWLEKQTWIWQQDEGCLVFFGDDGPQEFMERESGWFEMNVGHDNPEEDFTKVEDPRVVTLLNAKKEELQPH
jgi:hypothetical protein